MTELDEIKKLSPEERIKKLKLLEEAKRKEIAEAEELMKESVGEAEKREEIRQKMPVPQMGAVDIDSLFTKEEKEIYATKHFGTSHKEEPEEKPKKEEKTLEDEIIESEIKLSPQEIEQQTQYGQQLAVESPKSLYSMAKDAYNEFKETGQIDQGRMYALDVATRAKDEALGGEYKAASEQAQEQFGSVKSIIQYLRGK